MAAYQITQTITDPGTAPARTDPDNFDSRADAFLAVLSTWGAAGTGDLNVLKTQMNALSTAVNGYSTDAAASETAAEAAQVAAVAASNATAYDTGKVGGYAVGDVVYSTAGHSYRCIQIQAEGAVEALTNTAYWTLLGSTLDNILVLGDVGGGSDAIDLSSGLKTVVTATISTAEQTFTFTNAPPTGFGGGFTMQITNGGSQTINWPASVDWVGGTAPTLTAAGKDTLVFWTIDGGTIWEGFVVGLDVK